MNIAADDCACSAKHELAFELVSEILRARVDGSDMASFYGVMLDSFVAQVRGIRFSNFGVSGARQTKQASIFVLCIAECISLQSHNPQCSSYI